MTELETRATTKIDWLVIGVLVALILPLRLWLLHNTEVTARDSIGYIRYALQFEKKPWKDVCAANDQHPGYPVLIWLISQPVRAWSGETTPENMQYSAQMVSLIASLLLILPMYFLGRQFFDRTVSFGGALLYQYLPASGQHLSDGISEPAYLLLLTSAILQAVHAVRERSFLRSGLCGAFAGASYIIRPEGLAIVPAFAVVMIALQYRAYWRCSWKRFAGCAAAITLCVMLTASVYVIATGKISNKPTANLMVDYVFDAVRQLIGLKAPEPAAGTESLGGPQLFAFTFQPIDNKAIRLYRCTGALGAEIGQGFHYVGVVPAILGLWWSFGLLRRDPGYWLLMAYAAMHSLILISLAMSVYYVSDRHVMILVLGGSYFAVFGLREFAFRVWRAGSSGAPTSQRAALLTFAILFVTLIGFCLPRTTQRLHGNRAGNHEAGIWLADKLNMGDVIDDDHAWSHYFSSLLFSEGETRELPAHVIPMCYLVSTKSNDPAVNAERQKRVAADAKPVFIWPERSEVQNARVVVYCQPRDFARNPWRKAH